jgi:uncharacterized protein with PIN domain
MTRFLLDAMLGKLARYLRLCGYDAAYSLDRGVESDAALRRVARTEGRTIITRDRDFAARYDEVILLHETEIDDQLRELQAKGVELVLDEPAYCGRCNGPLSRVLDSETTPADAPAPAEMPVWRCTECGQFFWRGSHWDDVKARLASL